MKINGILLVGGQSRRIGFNKAFIEIGKKTVIQRIIDELSYCTKKTILLKKSGCI